MIESAQNQPNPTVAPVVSASGVGGLADEAIPTLCVHTKRREWGRALRIMNRNGRVAFQFEDGQLRVIAQTHMHLLERARVPAQEAIAVARGLRSVAGLDAVTGEHAVARRAPLIGLIQQVALFRDDYPDGFVDVKWKKNVRGEGLTKPLKRHRDRAIGLARATLNASELDILVETASDSEIVTRIGNVLDATDLVTREDAALFQRLTVIKAMAIGRALRAVLGGESALEARLQRFIDTLTRGTGRDIRWQPVTALPALIDPSTFPFVRPAAIREQAKSVGLALELSKSATGLSYAHVCYMVRRVALKLRDEGMPPHDLMDVTDFAWATLRPAARARLAELLAPRRQQAAAAATEITSVDAGSVQPQVTPQA